MTRFLPCYSYWPFSDTSIAIAFKVWLANLNISQPSVCRAIERVARAINRRLRHVISIPGPVESREISRAYRIKSNGKWQNVVVTIDGTLVEIKGPSGEPVANYMCRKMFPAINVQAVVDHRRRFHHVDARFPGSMHDSMVLRNTSVWRDFENGRRDGIILGKRIPGYSFRLISCLMSNNMS